MAKRNIEIVISAKDQAKQVLGQVGKAVAGLAAAAAAATAVMAGFGIALGKITMEAAKQQEADLRLSNALRAVGQDTAEVREELRLFNAEMQRATSVGDIELANIEAILISLGQLKGEGLKEATRATLDFAAALGQDAQAAAINIAKAATGYTSALTRYGIIIDENIPESEKFNAVLTVMQERFGGAAKVMGSTFLGQLRNVNNALGDLAEAIGKGIAENEELKIVLDAVIDSLGTLEGAFLKNNDAVGDLASLIAVPLVRVLRELASLFGKVVGVASDLPGLAAKMAPVVQAFAGIHLPLHAAAAGLRQIAAADLSNLSQLAMDLAKASLQIDLILAESLDVIAASREESERGGERLQNLIQLWTKWKQPITEAKDAVEGVGFALQEFHFFDTAVADMFDRVTIQTRTLLELWAEGADPIKKQKEEMSDLAITMGFEVTAAAQRAGDALVQAAFGADIAFKKFFKQLLADLASAIVQALILQALIAATGGAAGFFGKLFGAASGGEVIGGQRGGRVRGGSPGRDSVLTLLQPGEIVLPAKLKDDFATITDLSRAIRSGAIAEGGVPTVGGAQIQMFNTFQGAFGEDQMVELAADISDLVERKGVRLVSSEILS